jgi:outer membrane protein W
MAEDLSYRSVGSIDQADLEMPDAFAFTAIGSGTDTGTFSFGARSLAGIGTTSELGYVNSIGKDLMANGRFNIGEDVRWTSFAKTFDLVG